MSAPRHVRLLAVALVGLLAAATAVVARPVSASPTSGSRVTGQVFTLSNDPAGNEVLAFEVRNDGSLAPAGRFATGGTGSGAGLGSQGSLVASEHGRFLLAVNAGSDQVSVFDLEGGRVRLLDTDASGGDGPTSITIRRDLVYVLNNGDDTISGFRLGRHGLSPVPGSTRSLSQPADAGQIGFSPQGDHLIVTQKDTNRIDVFDVDRSGRTGPPVANAAVGVTPFGFAFDRYDHLVVSNAGGGPNGSTATSYGIGHDGTLLALDGPVPTHQSAACWVIMGPDGRRAYTTNAGSNSMSGFDIGRRGGLRLLDADGVTATTPAGPNDGDVSEASGYMFVLGAGADTIGGFSISRDGGLAPVSSFSGLPAAGVGLAAI